MSRHNMDTRLSKAERVVPRHHLILMERKHNMRIKLITLVLVSLTHAAIATESTTLSEFNEYVNNEERLFGVVKNFTDRMSSDKGITRGEIQKFERLLKKESVPDQILMVRMFKELLGRYDPAAPEPQYVVVNGVIQEVEDTVVVLGNRFQAIAEDPEEFSVGDIRYMRGLRKNANRLYRDGFYEEAYPVLLELAKRGFKDAQSRLAYILFHGTDNVPKSNLRALGWLGSAAHGRTEPGFRVLFKKFMREVPEHVRPTVDQVVAAYQAQYSHSEHLDCSIEHPYAEGVVKRTYCRFKLEAIADAQGPFRSWVDKVNTAE